MPATAPIGYPIEWEGHKLLVVEDGRTSCSHCFFDGSECAELQDAQIIPYCNAGDRHDRKAVHFEEVV